MSNVKQWFGFELDVVSQREKFVSLLGGCMAISALIYVVHDLCLLPLGTGLIASMGASAVLLFAVPHGQLSQPWPVLAGHIISAIIGVTCVRLLPGPVLAAGCAVGISIWVMHHLKCIHPPGGATALVAVLGGESIHSLGYWFVLAPVLINASIMVALAVVINYGFKWRRYPAGLCRVEDPVTVEADQDFSHDDVITALRELDLFIDVAEDDLVRLVQTLNANGRLKRAGQQAMLSTALADYKPENDRSRKADLAC